MRTKILITILLFVSLKGLSQFVFSVNSGYGSYDMGDMKSLQNQLAASLPVKPHVSPSFPSYWFLDINSKWVFKSQFLFGASFASGSTGGRVYYSDYSGNVGSDQLLSFQSYLLTLGFQKKFLGGHLTLEGDLRPGITATDLNLKSYIDIGTYSESNAEYKSQNFVLQPTLTVGGRFGFIGVQGFAGYNLTVASGRLHQVNSPDYLQVNGAAVHADWSGLRVGGGLSIYIDRDKAEQAPWRTAVGLGLGLDYGGIGINALTYPGKYVGMFCGIGYALAGVGYNAGLKIRTQPISSTKTTFYFLTMYGYNTAIAVTNKTDYNRLFYGPTVGVGVDFGQRPAGYWSLGLFVPIRSDEVNQYINSLSTSGVKTTSSLTPITFSVGYRFQREL